MYNEEYKMQYADTITVPTARNGFVRIAKQSEQFEIALGKDLHDFSNEETIRLLNGFYLTSPLTLRQYASCISKYQSIGLTGGVIRKPVSKDDVDFPSTYRKTYHASFSDLKSDLQSVVELDQGYASVVALCFAWMGVLPKDVGKILKSDVDLKNGILFYNGNQLLIEKDILQILRNYANLSVAYRVQGQVSEVSPLPSKYFITRMITKNSKKIPKEVTIHDISQGITKLSEKLALLRDTNNCLSYENVLRSGEFYRLRQLELSGLDVFDKHNEDAVQAIFSSTIPYYEITFMYKQYKLAFGL